MDIGFLIAIDLWSISFESLHQIENPQVDHYVLPMEDAV